MSGVADFSSTLTEAATIDGLYVKIPLPVKSQRIMPVARLPSKTMRCTSSSGRCPPPSKTTPKARHVIGPLRE
jgi:hypothetical protein